MQEFLIFGLGKTGISLIKFLLKQKTNNIIYAWDDSPKAREHCEKIFAALPVLFISPECLNWAEIETVFVSPGVSINFPRPHYIIELAKQHNCKISSDIALFLQLVQARKIIAITGTNGKSTTTSLISKILEGQNYKAAAVGNIGSPVLDLVPFKHDFYVLELSSFQLELCENWPFNIAILLDITADHLERYPSLAAYGETKAKIFSDARTKAIILVNNKINKEIYAQLKNKEKIPLSTKEILPAGSNGYSMLHNSNIIYYNAKVIAKISPKYTNHNENILCAYVCGKLLGLEEEKLIKSIEDFLPLQHRLEPVEITPRNICNSSINIRFINDSKATNGDSANRALKLYENIYWLAGGKIKKDNPIKNLYIKNVIKAYFFGESASLLFGLYNEKIPTKKNSFNNSFQEGAQGSAHQTSAVLLCKDLREAFFLSYKDALENSSKNPQKIYNILLSPAHSSWDQWQNFEERGNFFKELVKSVTAIILSPPPLKC